MTLYNQRDSPKFDSLQSERFKFDSLKSERFIYVSLSIIEIHLNSTLYNQRDSLTLYNQRDSEFDSL